MRLVIIVHIGLPKTASSYLQREVFARWRGIVYLEQAQLEHLVRMRDDETYLVSKERLAGRSFRNTVAPDDHGSEVQQRCIARLARMLPEARVLLCLRRHEGYLISLYKQYLHAGGTLPLEEFFDPRHDRGLIRTEELCFEQLIRQLDAGFTSPPFLFLQEELAEPSRLLTDLAQVMGGPGPDPAVLSSRRRNRGVGHHQATWLRRFNRMTRSQLNPSGILPWSNRVTANLRLDPRGLCCHWLAPLSRRELEMPVSMREAMAGLYRDDWEFVQQRVRTRLASPEGASAQGAPLAGAGA